MSEKPSTSCAQPAAGPIVAASAEPTQTKAESREEQQRMSVMVGREAPDFEATAFIDGAFKNIKLSDYKGKWIFLCFYPGDFTFV